MCEEYVPCTTGVVCQCGHLNLYPVHTVDAVDEKYEDKYERYLQPILCLGHYRRFCYEVEQLAFERERHWHDQGHEEDHLGHEEHEHLEELSVRKSIWRHTAL